MGGLCFVLLGGKKQSEAEVSGLVPWLPGPVGPWARGPVGPWPGGPWWPVRARGPVGPCGDNLKRIPLCLASFYAVSSLVP